MTAQKPSQNEIYSSSKELFEEQHYSLSSPQREVWFNQILYPNVPLYNVGGYVKIDGSVDFTIFHKAINRVIQENDALRIILHTGVSLPTQTFAENLSIALDLYDFSERENAQNQAIQWMKEEFVKPFQIYENLFFQFALCKISDKSYFWLKKYHYLIADARTISLIVRRVAEVYNCLLTGQAYSEQNSYSYRDFIEEDRIYLNSEKFVQDKRYWLEKYSSLPEPLMVREQTQKFKEQTIPSQRITLNFTGDSYKDIINFAKANNTSPYQMIMGIVYCYFVRLNSREDLVIGITTENRRTAFEQTVGFFMNVVPVWFRFSTNLSFVELTQAIGKELHQVQEHERVSISDIKGEGKFVGERQQQLFDIEFSYSELKLETTFAESPVEFIPLTNGVEQYPLIVLIERDENQANIRIDLDFSLGIFTTDEIERFKMCFEFLLGEILRSPNVPIKELQIIPDTYLKKILFEFNDTTRNYSQDKCIHQLFEEQAERTPNALAVVSEEQELTYHSLNQKANQLAHYLQKVGVKPEVLVGLCVERSLEMIVSILGILKAGGAYVPIDPNYPVERIAYMVSDSQVSVILTGEHLLDLLPATEAKVVCLDRDLEIWSGETQQNPKSLSKPENLAYVIYTSGSTGEPKGVTIEHRSIMNVTQAAKVEWGMSSRDRVLQFASISFDVAVQEIHPCLISGGTVVLRTQEMLSSISTFVQKCQEWQLTVLHLPPAFWHQLITELARTKQSISPSVRLVIIGGERVLLEKVKLWQEYVQQMLHSHQLVEPPQLINAYGPTEATVDATYCNLSAYVLEETLKEVPIGRAIANTQIYILDSELQPVPIGVKGELHIGGAGLARGYLNRPDLTTEKFIQNPFHTSQRLYKTGDYARYLPDGNIEFLGRIDNQVKIRGFRIELGEIEALLEQHPTIGQAVVIAVEDKLGDKRLVAYVVPHLKSYDEVEQQEIIPSLRDFLQGKIPEYMLPTAFKILEQLPLTPNDKVDRQALAQLPTDSYLSSEKTYVAPRTPEEEMLARLWAEVLDIEQVGIHDNFFELGGNSLKAIVLLNRVQQQLGKTFQMVDLFNAPTIADFADFLTAKSSLPEIEEITKSSNTDNSYFPPSFLQERFYFYRKFGSFYHLYNYFRLTGPLNVAVLEKSFNEIIRRHSILRTTLQQVNGSLMQVVAPVATVNMSVVQLQSMPDHTQLKEVEKLIDQEKQRQVTLDKDPWLRVMLLKLGEQSHILLICMHMLIANERSIDILLQELSVLYEAFLTDKPSPLAPLPLQYGNYALTQRRSLTPEVLQAKRNYWQQWLNLEPPLLPLPTDRPLPATQTFRADTLECQLSPDLSVKLKTLSQKKQVTLFTTILAAFATLLYYHSGTEDIVIGVPTTNRNHPKFESLIGDFGLMLVPRINLKGNPSFNELLNRVRQEMLSVMANQDVPFEQLAKTLQLERQRNQRFFRVYLDFLLEAPKEELKLSGLTVTSSPIQELMARVDLGLLIWQENTASGTSLQVWWRYKKDLFEKQTIAQMAKNFETLLEAIIASPERSVKELLV
ncbi:amino acid adenylation domain-containing protein [Scytonema sp. NUACC26]|uniref:non-ribosomal peptide synthetase n=1 Tax=Scytonema sp. NUACC26 TaxID=3140176 RepID=UPI0034DC1525